MHANLRLQFCNAALKRIRGPRFELQGLGSMGQGRADPEYHDDPDFIPVLQVNPKALKPPSQP